MTKLSRIGKEKLLMVEIQIGGDSFRKIKYLLGKSLRFYKHQSISAKDDTFRRKNTFQKKGATLARKQAKAVHQEGGEIKYLSKNSLFSKKN